MLKINNNENYEICSACGGNCCIKYPGVFHPDDLVIDKDVLRDRLKKGHISIDRYDMPGYKIYFLRPRRKDGPIVDFEAGECIYNEDHGCILPFESRPYGCRFLTHSESGECYGAYLASNIISDWDYDVYQDLLEELVREFSR